MEPLVLGADPINFSLKGVDNKVHSFDDYTDKKFVAVMFSCNHCPYVVASEREFVEIQEKFGPDSFQLIAINSNSANPDYPGDSFENMVKRAEEKNFNFPYLVDDDQSIAKKYGAGRTPEIFLFDEQRKLVYHGRINDNPKVHSDITRHDLQIALEELIAGKEVTMPTTPPIGCSIKYLDY